MKKLLWVLGFSVALHLALLFGPHLSLPLSMAPAPELNIKLEIPPPAVVAQRETAKPPRPRPPQPKPRRLPAKDVLPAPIAPDHSVAEPAPQPVPPPAVEPAPEEEKSPPMPQNATIKFAVYKGVNGMRVGRAEQTWKLDGEHFTISSVAEATGLFSLFASGKHVQISQGEITPSGLKPASYRVERGQGEDKVDAARFDWSAMTLALASGSDRKTVKLPEGTQDLLSFMYQLAFAPPQRSAVQLSITNGRKLDSYVYWVVEEALETPMGTLQTLHLGKRREEGEKDTEVWLAADYHYLPVKISQVDKDGDGLVLLVNEIAITQ
ncbi:MAG: DUF3108 domain-containing protein [Betaproteobacteria bacterium]|nr:DUF3108 domain-containing protein [Betaproteobacteria bacterium]